jgi:hypothetical protein
MRSRLCWSVPQEKPVGVPAAIMFVTIDGSHEARPHVLSHDLKDSTAKSCPAPFAILFRPITRF